MSMKARLAIFLSRWRALDPIARAMILHWIQGMGVGLVCTALILLFDFAGLRTLLWNSDMPVVGTLLLVAGFAFSFGGLVAAGGAMNGFGADDDDQPGGGLRYRPLREPQPAPLRVGAVIRGR
jgi:hypothetical protein